MEDMKTLRKPTKLDVLLNLFPTVGTSLLTQSVLEITEVKNRNTLKAMLSYIRKSPHVAEEARVDIALRGNYCIRVN